MEGDVILTDVSSSGGYVTQDQDGYIILPPNGDGSPSVGGLEYETGTWTPESDVSDYLITLNNTHTAAPYYYMITDESGSYSSATTSSFAVIYNNFHQLFGQAFQINSTGDNMYAIVHFLYRSSSADALSGTAGLQITHPYTDTVANSNIYSRYWATETTIRAYTNSTSRYFRAGRTYKWIAVWAPTT